MQKIRNLLDFSKDLLVALLAAILVIQFVAMHTEVPSGSMIPTINEKDHLVISQFTAYYKLPKIGDIVIFHQGGDRLVKRVIAQGGDKVDLIDGKVYINDQVIDETSYIRKEDSTYPFSWSDIEFPYYVPEESYFMMGDNREESADSRVFGAIKEEDVIAIGAFRIYPFNNIGVLE